MNKLKNTEQTGGYPLVMDDFRFMQDALRDGFKAHLNAIARIDTGAAGIKRRLVFADDNELLIDASNSWTFPETYVYNEGELYRIPETVLNSSPAGYSYILVLDISDDPNGTKTFQDATTHETHEIRQGSIVREQFPALTDFVVLKGSASGYTFNNDNLYKTRLNNYLTLQELKDNETALLTLLNELNGGWSTVTPDTTNIKLSTNTGGTDTITPSAVGGGYIKYRKAGNVLHVDFQIVDVTVDDQATLGNYINSIHFDKSIIGVANLRNVRAVCRMESDNNANVSGVGRIAANSGKVIFTMPKPFSSGFCRLNDEYQPDTVTANTFNDTVERNFTNVSGNWTIEGQFTIQFD